MTLYALVALQTCSTDRVFVNVVIIHLFFADEGTMTLTGYLAPDMDTDTSLYVRVFIPFR